jgi:hypothetical protein
MPQCAKKRYPDVVAARIDLKRIWKGAGAEEKVAKRAYPCNECGGWHLTSQRRPDKEPWRRAKAKRKN